MARYDFFANKKVSLIGKQISKIANAKLADMMLRNFPSEQNIRILEIGPGRGDFAQELRSKNSQIQYKAYEADELIYKNLVNQNFDVELGKVPPLNEQDGSFSCVVLLNVLEHMQGVQEAEAMIAEAYRVLSPGGIFFAVTPSFLSWGKDFYNFDYTHSFITTELRLSQMFQDADFLIKKITYHYGCFFSDFGRVADFATKVARGFFNLVLPRKFGRNTSLQKMGMLFAENIIIIGKKQ